MVNTLRIDKVLFACSLRVLNVRNCGQHEPVVQIGVCRCSVFSPMQVFCLVFFLLFDTRIAPMILSLYTLDLLPLLPDKIYRERHTQKNETADDEESILFAFSALRCIETAIPKKNNKMFMYRYCVQQNGPFNAVSHSVYSVKCAIALNTCYLFGVSLACAQNCIMKIKKIQVLAIIDICVRFLFAVNFYSFINCCFFDAKYRFCAFVIVIFPLHLWHFQRISGFLPSYSAMDEHQNFKNKTLTNAYKHNHIIFGHTFMKPVF